MMKLIVIIVLATLFAFVNEIIPVDFQYIFGYLAGSIVSLIVFGLDD